MLYNHEVLEILASRVKNTHYHNYSVIKEIPESHSNSHSKVMGGHLKIKVEQDDILANMVQSGL